MAGFQDEIHSTNRKLREILSSLCPKFECKQTSIYTYQLWRYPHLIFKVTYLLTSWSRVLLEKLTSKHCSWSQNSPHLWNPKVPHRTHKCPPPVPILSQPHSVPMTPSNFLKVHLNIILPSMSWSPQWPPSLWLPHQHPVHTSILPHTRHIPCPPHSSRFYHPHNIGWAVQIIQLLVMQLSPFPCHLIPLRSKYSPQHPILKHPQPVFLPQCQRPGFTPIQNHRQNYSSIYLDL